MPPEDRTRLHGNRSVRGEVKQLDARACDGVSSLARFQASAGWEGNSRPESTDRGHGREQRRTLRRRSGVGYHQHRMKHRNAWLPVLAMSLLWSTCCACASMTFADPVLGSSNDHHAHVGVSGTGGDGSECAGSCCSEAGVLGSEDPARAGQVKQQAEEIASAFRLEAHALRVKAEFATGPPRCIVVASAATPIALFDQQLK